MENHAEEMKSSFTPNFCLADIYRTKFVNFIAYESKIIHNDKKSTILLNKIWILRITILFNWIIISKCYWIAI